MAGQLLCSDTPFHGVARLRIRHLIVDCLDLFRQHDVGRILQELVEQTIPLGFQRFAFLFSHRLQAREVLSLVTCYCLRGGLLGKTVNGLRSRVVDIENR